MLRLATDASPAVASPSASAASGGAAVRRQALALIETVLRCGQGRFGILLGCIHLQLLYGLQITFAPGCGCAQCERVAQQQPACLMPAMPAAAGMAELLSHFCAARQGRAGGALDGSRAAGGAGHRPC